MQTITRERMTALLDAYKVQGDRRARILAGEIEFMSDVSSYVVQGSPLAAEPVPGYCRGCNEPLLRPDVSGRCLACQDQAAQRLQGVAAAADSEGAAAAKLCAQIDAARAQGEGALTRLLFETQLAADQAPKLPDGNVELQRSMLAALEEHERAVAKANTPPLLAKFARDLEQR